MISKPTTVEVYTHRMYDGQKAGHYLSVFRASGNFFEPSMTAISQGLGIKNNDAHFRSVVNDFGDLVVIHRYN